MSKLKVIYCPQKGVPKMIDVNSFYINEMVLIHSNYYLGYIKKDNYKWRYIFDDINNETLKYSSYYVPNSAIIFKQNENLYENYFNREDVENDFFDKLPQILG